MSELTWQSMDNAPRDGEMFLVRDLPYVRACVCWRKIRWVLDEGRWKPVDGGGWIKVTGQVDFVDMAECHATKPGDPSVSFAPDDLNDIS